MKSASKTKDILVAKPFQQKEGQKYKVITITDIKFHSNNQDKSSLGKVWDKAFATGKEVRAYTPHNPDTAKKNQMKILEIAQEDPELIKFIKEQESLGYKVLLQVPKEIPIRLGADAEKFLNSKKGKRILRWSCKEK